MFVKVCGITRLTDALLAVQHGATALGFIFWPRSPRFVTPARAAEIVGELPSSILTVGVFVNEEPDGIRAAVRRSGVAAVQLHGDEPAAYAGSLPWPILRSATPEAAEAVGRDWADALLLLDAHDPQRRGGTGQTTDWSRAAQVARTRKVVLAGGLTPENVGEAIRLVRPYGVDVSSGVEEAPGVKDFVKVRTFLTEARSALELVKR